MNIISKFIAIGLAIVLIAIGTLGLVFTFVWTSFDLASNNFAPYNTTKGYVYPNATPAPNQDYDYGYGMMGRGGGMMGRGGMMGGYYNQDQIAPTAPPTQAGATPATVEQDIKITSDDLRFNPSQITVKAGSTVRFVITNNDTVPHNFVSQSANIPYLVLPATTTQTLVWTAPAREGTYTALCTLHPGMIVTIAVKK